MTPSCKRPGRAAARALLAAVLLVPAALAGCGRSNYGPSDYAKMPQREEGAADYIRNRGGKLAKKSYPQGQAWTVDLHGATIDDELFTRLKELVRITELNLSKTNLTDEQMARINDDTGSLILKLDVSNTAVSDAGLDKLTGLPILTNLNLSGTKVTAAGVDRFRKSRQSNPNVLPVGKAPLVQR